MDVDDARACIGALRHRAANTAQQFNTLDRGRRQVTQDAEVYESGAIDDDERHVRAAHGNGAPASACADTSWPTVLILGEFVLSRAIAQQIPRVGRGGTRYVVGADNADLSAIAG